MISRSSSVHISLWYRPALLPVAQLQGALFILFLMWMVSLRQIPQRPCECSPFEDHMIEWPMMDSWYSDFLYDGPGGPVSWAGSQARYAMMSSSEQQTETYRWKMTCPRSWSSKVLGGGCEIQVSLPNHPRALWICRSKCSSTCKGPWEENCHDSFEEKRFYGFLIQKILTASWFSLICVNGCNL